MLYSITTENYNLYNKIINIALILSMCVNTSILSYNAYNVSIKYTNIIRGMVYSLREYDQRINFYAAEKDFAEGSFIQKFEEANLPYKFVDKQEYEQESYKYKPVPMLLDKKLLWDYQY